jgi:proteasome lid subunit RPN8/RPN11
MGLFGRKKPKEPQVRPDFQSLPQEEWTEEEFDLWFATLSEQEQWAHWERWSLETYEHPTIKKILGSVIDMGMEAAKASHPHEFAAMLRVEGDTVTELLLVPGTIQGDQHAIFQFGMLPVDRSIKGTLHSHPSPHPYPSDADFALFEKHGMIHLILGEPFGPDDWRAYDHTGTPTFLEVVEDGEGAGADGDEGGDGDGEGGDGDEE